MIKESYYLEHSNEISIEAHPNYYIWEKWQGSGLEGLVSRTQYLTGSQV